MAKKKPAPRGKQTAKKAKKKTAPKPAKARGASKAQRPKRGAAPPKATARRAGGGPAKTALAAQGKKAAAKAPAQPTRMAKPAAAAKRTEAKAAPQRSKIKPGTGAKPAAVKKAQAPPPAAPAPPKAGARPAPSPAPPKRPSPPAEQRPVKSRVVMEFAVHSNPNVLYELISSPSGFSEWYCDDVDVRGDQYTFKWGPDEETATLIGRKAPEVIRFRRNGDDDPAAYFEFRIRIDDMTGEVALIVTDHAWPDEVEPTRNLWASQIANLARVLGA